MNEIPKTIAIENLTVGDKYSFNFKINSQMMLDFKKISGDLNPLHNDKEFAISRGYQDKVVYGGLLIAQVSKMLGMYLPGRDSLWTHIDLSFLKPFYVGEEGEISTEVKNISIATSLVDLKIKIVSVHKNILKVRGKACAIIINSK